jgi:hypothetical protein
VEDNYGDDAKKLALLTTSYRQTKTDLIRSRGIGEDLPFNFFGWKHNDLAVTIQMNHEVMNRDLYERFDKSYRVCSAIRQYWGCDEITMVAEGFLSYDPMATSGKSLREAFVKNENVSECITLTHAFTVNGRPQISVVAMPYSYNEKQVTWHKMIATPNEAVKLFRESIFPAMLVKSITEKIAEEYDEETRSSVAQQIADDGFQVYDFSGGASE